MTDKEKNAIIIGAGPAGLTAAYELLDKTNIKPIVFEACEYIGGISKTIDYKGNKIDIGGHRFFSKSDRIMAWWENIFPVAGAPAWDDKMLGRDLLLSKKADAPDPEQTDRVMLIRKRLSRIYFLQTFFDYPISLKWQTISNLGIIRMTKIGLSYLYTFCFPIQPEKSLEDFFINRFGRELYLTFFKDYTEKVWGVPCTKIRPEWGAQRIKGLSVIKTVLHAIKNLVRIKSNISQKDIETSLIEYFLYPKYGPGQLWEEVAEIIKQLGGKIYLNHKVTGLKIQNKRVIEISVEDTKQGERKKISGDYFFSTMPVKELISSLEPPPPKPVQDVAEGLAYRDFLTVGVLLKELKIKNSTNLPTINDIIPDNWIYIQEKNVRVGRIQIFNNWSPYLVRDRDTVWLGLEYFTNEGDDIWTKTDKEMAQFAVEELKKINFISSERDVIDWIVIRTPKAYPAYFGTYDNFQLIREFTDKIENLFLIGRNGMHRYNNQDHSMLTAIEAVNNIRSNILTKDNIWNVNTEQEYQEKK